MCYIYIYIYIYTHTYTYTCIDVCTCIDVQTYIHYEVPAEGSGRLGSGAAPQVRSKQRDPNPQDNSLIRKETSTNKGFRSTFAALFSYYGVFVGVRVPLCAAHQGHDPRGRLGGAAAPGGRAAPRLKQANINIQSN